MRQIGYDDMRGKLSWKGAVAALRQGHRKPPGEVGDVFLGPAGAVLLSRAAYIEGLGYGVKSVSVFENNAERDLPTVQGGMLVFGPEDGRLEAVIESRLVTEWKTAADSVLGASLLARPDSKTLLIVGAGVVAGTLVQAYPAILPGLERILVWNRTPARAEALAEAGGPVPISAVSDLGAACAEADIVAAATMSRNPVLEGAWIRPGTHVDLIGAFTAEMREADDALIAGGRLFVDSRETTIDHIGELVIPIREGIIGEADIAGDLYELVSGAAGRGATDEITIYKNGGGAHMDLMIARWIAEHA